MANWKKNGRTWVLSFSPFQIIAYEDSYDYDVWIWTAEVKMKDGHWYRFFKARATSEKIVDEAAASVWRALSDAPLCECQRFVYLPGKNELKLVLERDGIVFRGAFQPNSYSYALKSDWFSRSGWGPGQPVKGAATALTTAQTYFCPVCQCLLGPGREACKMRRGRSLSKKISQPKPPKPVVYLEPLREWEA